MARERQVTIYTTATCPWCTVAKRYFAENDIEYADIDVSESRMGLEEMVRLTGQFGVPVVRVDEEAMVGWDPAEFRRMMDG